MSHLLSGRSGARRTRSTVLATLVVVSAAIVGARTHESPDTPSVATGSRPADTAFAGTPSADHPTPTLAPADNPIPRPSHNRDATIGLGVSDGALPDEATVFADTLPAVTNLDPVLLANLRQAATDAAGDGVQIHLNSGWRSAEYQEQLLRGAIAEYGSEEEASRWVAAPEVSAHVSGDAVDVGPPGAAEWLSERGARYGLCQIYGNEPWHFELRPEAIGSVCPPMYRDPTHDRRMQAAGV